MTVLKKALAYADNTTLYEFAIGTDFSNHLGLLWNLIALEIRFETDQKFDFSVIETNIIIGFIFESEFDVIVVLSETIRSADFCQICSFFYFLFC